MNRKYKKEKVVMVDLTDRKNIKIIEAEKTTMSDHDAETLRAQLNSRVKAAEEFQKYFIQKELGRKRNISDEEFKKKMKETIKQQKILKYLIENKDTN